MTPPRPTVARLRRLAGVVALVAVLVLAVVPAAPGAAATAEPSESGDEVALVVGYHEHVDERTAEAVEAAADVEVVEELEPLDARVVEVEPEQVSEAIATLARDPRVEYVEPRRPVVADTAEARIPTDPLWPSVEPEFTTSQLPDAWGRTTGTSDVVIAVIDDGFDTTHPDLAGRLSDGWDAVAGTSNIAGEDTDTRPSHGTLTAQLAGAAADNDFGGAGVCWSCTLLPIKIADEYGYLWTDGMAAGIVHAVDAGADVISMSVSSVYDTLVVRDAVAYAAAHDVLLVTSAGNLAEEDLENPDSWDDPHYPAALPEVIGVAGTDPDDPGRVDQQSVRGAWTSLAAPFCHVTATRTGQGVWFCGTSSSTPVVAGIAGLLRSVAPTASAQQVRTALEATAVPVDGVGRGRVAAAAALDYLDRHPVSTTAPPAAAAGPGFGSWAAHPVVSGASAPAAVSWDGSRTDLFVVAGGQLRQRWQTSAGWGPSGGWHSLGRPSSTTLVGQPAVAAQRSGYLDVVARGADGQVWYRYYRAGKGWSGWSSLGGQITGGPAAVSWGVGHLAVVGWSPNGKLYVKSYDRGWSGWKAFSGQVTSAPGIASWGSGRLDVFARGADGSLHHYWFSGGRWGGPKSLGGQLAGGERPDAVAWGKNRLDVFVVGTNARVYRKSYSPSTSWTGFTGFPAVPGGFQPGTAVSSRRDGHLQLFVRDGSGAVWHTATS